MVPGLILTTLFFFDVEVSTICATLSRYNVRKPGGYAWDVFLLGLTTGLCGILGIPPANGLLPQAPLHSESLLHIEEVKDPIDGSTKKITTVHEQRWSHLLHAVGILAFVSPPLMHVLGLTPTSVLAGLFLYMGEQSLSVNPILFRSLHMLTHVPLKSSSCLLRFCLLTCLDTVRRASSHHCRRESRGIVGSTCTRFSRSW